jgi:TonB family protein
MRVWFLLQLLIVGATVATTVREYRDGEWKSVITARPTPEYPFTAREYRMQGEGWFRVSFARDGKVTDVQVLKTTGHQMLDKASISALWHWHAKPGLRRELDLPIDFSIPRGPPTPRKSDAILREFSS